MKKSNMIEEKIAELTLRQKAAQLTQLNRNIIYTKGDAKMEITGEALEFGLNEEDCASVGSILSFGEDEREDIQKTMAEKSNAQIPAIFMLDVIHGYRTIYPVPLAMGCTFDNALAEDCAEMAAKEARAAGVDVTFSPMVDLVRDSRWGRVVETTGEDHYLNGEMGKAFIRGYHKGGLAACVKHFAGYGAPEAGRDYNTVELSDYSLHEYYYYAYRECLKENPELFMSSFNVLNGKPVNARKDVLVDLLRTEWGFDGVLISDYNAIEELYYHGYSKDRKNCAYTSIDCQIDIEMMSVTYLDYLEELVQEGSIKEKDIDQMVRRVLKLKEKLGLFECPNGGFDNELYQKLCLSETHRTLARRAAEESFVLLKNKDVLPLKKDERVAFIGPFVDEQHLLGAWKAKGRIEETQTIREAAEKFLGDSIVWAKGCGFEIFADDESGFKEAERVAKEADTLVLCIGEHAYYSGEGTSRANPNIPHIQVDLIKRLKRLNKRIVAVIFAGRPLILTDIEPYIDSILYVWQPGTEGANAIVNTLYGCNNPCGKTVMSFPRSVGQCPIHYNEFHGGRRKRIDDMNPENYVTVSAYIDELNAPLYPFGFGLSYTNFTLSSFKLSANVMKKKDEVIASVVLTNSGTMDGTEVVQLYIRDIASSFVRPVKELKGYQRIFLKAGESKTVSFKIDESLLSYHDDKGKLLCEEGDFGIMLGTSSASCLMEKLVLEAE